MNKILTIMWKDVSILFRDRAALLLIIAGPLLLTIGMGLVTGSFNRDDDAPAISRIPLIIVDQDGGPLAVSLADLLTGDDLGELLAPQRGDDETAALEQVRRGDAAAAVIIPAGFSAALTPDPATGDLPPAVALRVYGDPGSPIGAGVVRGIVEEFTNRVQTGVTTVQVDLIKGWTFKWARLENEQCIMTIGSGRPMEDAARIAYRELVRWMASDYGFDELDAYMLLTQAGRVRLGNMVDPKYTLGASIAKALLG